MITRRTQIQLLVFVLITLVGVSYVGAKYAKLDRIFFDRDYDVVARFTDPGGAFVGAEVSYRGVKVGSVRDMIVTDAGVDVVLSIENSFDDIPANTIAVVANRSAVGEQYVNLEPQSNGSPFLTDRAVIPESRTRIPISTTDLLVGADDLTNSLNRENVTTVITELNKAFNGVGDDLGRVIDTSTSFIETANDNFELTTRLLRDSNIVLSTQLDKASAIRSFAQDLADFSDTLVAADGDLREIISTGGATARELRSFLQQNRVNLGRLIRNLVTTGEVTVKHLDGIEMVLVLYPYVAAGSYVVNYRAPGSQDFNAHFGMVLTETPPVCTQGYNEPRRQPQDLSPAPMDMNARCTEPPTQSNPRGAAQAPRVVPGEGTQLTFDAANGKITVNDETTSARQTYDGGASALGDGAWQYLLLQPLAE